MSHWKISYFVSLSLFGFTLAIKLRNIDFGSHWNTLIFFDKKKWCQIWICPVKQCLIRFKLYCLSRILAISWEIRTVNFIEILSRFFFAFFFFYFCWHYNRNSFKLKTFLMILRYTEILYWKFCICRGISGCCPRTNE